ncbi:vacuolar protein sorting-associated protein 26C isoform X2 [Boleophthalmus pectinirostris]|uniref:vacuolar protein sorting-associated protein 26C isoform X2 n=1 Tax=Boleophthalmus pectinirostris TaxID=150288 RepID=UPI00242D4B03|nr:vacuolar protein sorting-associated protein 26C isoform X2 [Boleophthalmus pectinirostris]
MAVSVDIRLKRANKVYHEGEVLSGVVVLQSKEPLPHHGILLTLEGLVNLQLSSKSVGVFEAFYNSVKYTLRCDVKRPLLAKDLSRTCEFIVHGQPQKAKVSPSPVSFSISPETLHNNRERACLPQFCVRGRLDASCCVVSEPLRGEVVVEQSDVPVKSIELQLVRVETCGCAEGYARDATEIQNIQIAEGDVCHGLPIPIYMVFPRLFTCPTLETPNFKVEFEVNIVIVLQDDHLITENFPLKLCRV